MIKFKPGYAYINGKRAGKIIDYGFDINNNFRSFKKDFLILDYNDRITTLTVTFSKVRWYERLWWKIRNLFKRKK